MPPPLANRGRAAIPRHVWVSALLLAAMIGMRFWLAIDVPLMDTTEARYAEMARKMAETGDWLMPQHAYGVPYFAKPPLAIWLSALGIEGLGATALAVRLPILVTSLVFGAIFFGWLRKLFGTDAAAAGVLMLASTFLFYVSTAAVMTDLLLTAFAATALMAFWSRLQGGPASTEVCLYVALALGLLTKGPVAAVLVLTPIAAWSALTGQTGRVWRRFAWLRGACLTAGIALPWYVAAEWQHPGFLHYFIVGEHLGRFLTPGWPGDIYGFAHQLPRGTIWPFYLIGMLPWTIVLAVMAPRAKKMFAVTWLANRNLVIFALSWALTPLALFSLSANIIWPYALPAVPATVVVLTALLTNTPRSVIWTHRFAWGAAVTLLVGGAWIATYPAITESHSRKAQIEAIESRHHEIDHEIVYWGKQYYSAEFYSRGTARSLGNLADLEYLLDHRKNFSLIVRDRALSALPAAVRKRLEIVSGSGDAIVLEPLVADRSLEPNDPARGDLRWDTGP